ncbi:MAG: DUF805 domain-containing protein [Muribaculaceae bacterium]|nr:DUF805 domain-containing protein [Muribaculaceae bacterium]
MTFNQAVSSVFSKYVTFSGRASRSEFWYFVVFELFVYVVLYLFGWLFSGPNGELPAFVNILSGLFGLIVLLPSLAVSVRRMHDIGKGGGWIFINLVPFIGEIWFIILALQKGEPAPNRFGAVPA